MSWREIEELEESNGIRKGLRDSHSHRRRLRLIHFESFRVIFRGGRLDVKKFETFDGSEGKRRILSKIKSIRGIRAGGAHTGGGTSGSPCGTRGCLVRRGPSGRRWAGSTADRRPSAAGGPAAAALRENRGRQESHHNMSKR